MIGRTMALACALALGLAGAARAEMADVDGGQVWWEACGKASDPPLVLIHDGVINSASLDDLWPILCRDFHVVRYDRRGYGKSPAAKAPYSAQDDLAAVIRAAGLGRTNLAGFSFGGGLALSYAIQHPEQVDRLVLCGSALNGFAVSKHFERRNQHIFLPILLGNVDAVIANAGKDPWLLAPGHDAALARATAIAKANPQDFRHQLRDPIRPWPSDLPMMPELKVPTLILVGDHDIPDVQAMAGAAQALIPGSKRIIVDDAGHLMQLEHPKEVAGLIEDFVKGR
jgi:pimeloyl-ACP methyl ester carboxylesterase